MKPLYVLIDFENVQPKVLERLRPGLFRVKVFLGQHQSKLMLDLVQRLQPFGTDAEYVQIQGSGPDAVDFHIAYYIGRIAALEPGATFIVVSKDKGFDPLLKHLALHGVECTRLPELPELKAPKAAESNDAIAPTSSRSTATAASVAVKAPAKPVTASASTRSRAKAVAEHLKKSTRPATVAKLRASIKAWFQPPLEDPAVDAILQSLQDSKLLRIAGAKVSYTIE